jgi:ADP-heptose:LPS heptosyltransferase
MNVPMYLPLYIAMQYVDKYKDIKYCNNPEGYFKDRKLRRLIIRDAGIGDLILLEPILRKMGQDNKIDVYVACMYPEVFENHPNIKAVYEMETKNGINNLRLDDFDSWEDLRNYSETHNTRDKEHRTDIYNIPFQISLSNDEKEPRLYFTKKEKSIIKKKEGYNYIGIQCDASHSYRRYDRGRELIQYILQVNKKNICVLLGSYDFVKNIHHKRIIDLQGKTTRRQAINIIKDLDYLIAADSGLMHVGLTLHVPTTAIFSIITPDYRTRYYKGQHKIIWKNVECRGCGNWHMTHCKHGDKKTNKDFTPPCLDLTPGEIYNKTMGMNKEKNKNIYYFKNDIVKDINKKIIEKEVNVIPKKTNKKLTMPIILLNEEKNLPRFIELVMNNKYIGRTIAIDGGSNDKSVELLKKAGAEVYIHPYLQNYHEMQAMQRNISCSYVKDGENIIIMDLDECFSRELEEYLPVLAESDYDFGLISRRTFNYYADIKDPKKQIKDYPDYQPRFYKWHKRFKFVGGAHHNTINTPEPVLINKDIIHFEKEGKSREQREKLWSNMMKGVSKYA